MPVYCSNWHAIRFWLSFITMARRRWQGCETGGLFWNQGCLEIGQKPVLILKIRNQKFKSRNQKNWKLKWNQGLFSAFAFGSIDHGHQNGNQGIYLICCPFANLANELSICTGVMSPYNPREQQELAKRLWFLTERTELSRFNSEWFCQFHQKARRINILITGGLYSESIIKAVNFDLFDIRLRVQIKTYLKPPHWKWRKQKLFVIVWPATKGIGCPPLVSFRPPNSWFSIFAHPSSL